MLNGLDEQSMLPIELKELMQALRTHSACVHEQIDAGDVYLRIFLIQGARSSLQRVKAVSIEKATPDQLWIRGKV